MVYTICWGLMVLVIIAVSLHMTDQADRRRIEQADRAYQAALDRANALGTPQDPQRHMQNNLDMGNRSRPHENGPEIAKSEGVQRGSGNH